MSLDRFFDGVQVGEQDAGSFFFDGVQWAIEEVPPTPLDPYVPSRADMECSYRPRADEPN